MAKKKDKDPKIGQNRAGQTLAGGNKPGFKSDRGLIARHPNGKPVKSDKGGIISTGSVRSGKYGSNNKKNAMAKMNGNSAYIAAAKAGTKLPPKKKK